MTCGLGEDSESDCGACLVSLELDELAWVLAGGAGGGVGADRVVVGGSGLGGAPIGCGRVLRGGGDL